MANELVHASVGTAMTQAEFEAVGLHVCNSQATGDLIYASSASQLSRLGIGATNAILTVIGGVPTWQTTLAGLTLTSPTINTLTLGGNIIMGSYWLSGDGGNEGISVDSSGDVGICIAASTNARLQIGLPANSGQGILGVMTPAGTGAFYVLSIETSSAGTGSGALISLREGVAGGERALLSAAGATGGKLVLSGSTSGTVTMAVVAAAGTWTLTLPTTAGTVGQKLTTDGAGVCTWT